MEFTEATAKYGIDSARQTFGLSDHLVIVVHPGRYVTGTCGKWHASMPLGSGQKLSTQIKRLAEAIDNCHATEEIIVDN